MNFNIMKKSNVKKVGIVAGLALIGSLIYIAKRFYLKVRDNGDGTINVKLVDGFNSHTKQYSLDNAVSEQIFEDYKLHIQPLDAQNTVTVSLHRNSDGQRLELQTLNVSNTSKLR